MHGGQGPGSTRDNDLPCRYNGPVAHKERCILCSALLAGALCAALAGCRDRTAPPDANATDAAERTLPASAFHPTPVEPVPREGAITRFASQAARSVRQAMLDRRRWDAAGSTLASIAAAAARQYQRDPNTWIVAGDGAMERGDWPLAVECMRRAVALDANSLAARRALAVALTAGGDFAEVIRVYDGILARDGSDTTSRFNLALALARQRDFARAEEEYRRLLNAREDFVQGWYNLATILQAQGKLHEAVRAWRRVIELSPKMAGAHASLGELLIDMGKPEEAMKVYADAVQITPKAAGTWLNLANAAQACGSHGKALAALEKAAELAPRDAAVWSRLGEGYMDLYRTKEERRFLERAVDALEKSVKFSADDETKKRLDNAKAALAATTRKTQRD